MTETGDSHFRMQRAISTLILLLTGCATAWAVDSADIDMAARVEKLSRLLKEKNLELDKVREENLILKGHGEGGSVNAAPVQPKIPQFNSEAEHYSFIIKTYREKDLPTLRAAINSFLQNYPLSVLADNALYLQGMSELNKNQLGEAVKTFEIIARSYPQGNKRVSALFAKGITYRKLNLSNQAGLVFREVVKTYPGSPESYRARMELKLLTR